MIVGIFTTLFLLSGCSSADSSTSDPNGSQNAVPSDMSGGSDLDAEVPGELDQRVIDAVAPISGASMPSSRWLKDASYNVTLPQVSSCLEDRGRLDLLPMMEASHRFFEGSDGYDPFLYPEPEHLLANGLGGENATLPAEFVEGITSQDASSDGGVVMACASEGSSGEEISRVNELRMSIGTDWARLVERISYDERMMPHYEGFAECLRSEGVPDEAATGNPGDFILWAEGARMSQDPAAARELGLEQARQYVSCGEKMFEARAGLLQAERDGFIEAHRDQFQELTTALVTLRVG